MTMNVICELCQSAIEAENIDLDKGIAKCTECNNVFDCGPQLQSSKNYRREDIGLPGSIKLRKEESSLTIEFKWRNSQLFYLIPFCICWDFAPAIWAKTGVIPTDDPLGIAYLVIHILTAIALTYYTLAKLLNKTKITVVDKVLQAVDSPLPFMKNISISVEKLTQLYSKEKIHRGKKMSFPSYEVHAIMKSGRVTRLVSGLKKSEQALYIEQTLEDYLGILDRPVDGEISR